jgi:hypothetical protein
MFYGFEPNSLPAGCESLGLRRTRMNFGEEGNPPMPHAVHETLVVLGATVVGMTT